MNKSTSRKDKINPQHFCVDDGLSLSGIVQAIVYVGQQRSSILSFLREALKAGDNDKALDLARQLCGLTNAKSTRIH